MTNITDRSRLKHLAIKMLDTNFRPAYPVIETGINAGPLGTAPQDTRTTPKKLQPRVLIANSPYGPSASTSIEHARRLVRRNRARFDASGRLELLPHVIRENEQERAKRVLGERGYDYIMRPMTLEEIAGIPVVAPEKLLIDRGRRNRN